MLRSMSPSNKRNRPLVAGAELLVTKLAEIRGELEPQFRNAR
jgi:hypothetical protein